MTSSTLLYLHGFASGPASRKGVAVERELAPHGIRVVRLDMRLPDRDHLRLSAMVARVEAALVEERASAIAGSSLGGLVAAIVAWSARQLRAAVLLAPAVGFASRWSARLGEPAMDRWRAGEPLVVEDYAGGPPLRVDYGFYADAVQVETAWQCIRRSGPVCAVPTLIVQGLRDDVLDPAAARSFADELSDARLLEVDDGHELLASLPRTIVETTAFLLAHAVGVAPPD